MYRATLLALTALGVLLAACGGGSTGVAPPIVDPPTALSYASDTVLYRTETPIAPNPPTVEGGTPTSYAVSPDLPAGLELDAVSGVLDGTPEAPAGPADYEVTARNGAGEATTVINVEVRWHATKSLHPATSLSAEDHRHFLRRTHWGIRPLNLEALESIGLDAYVDAMLQFPEIGSTQHEQQAEALLQRETDPPGLEGMFPSRRHLGRWWLTLMVTNPNTFQEVLAFFWHDHFATSSEALSGGSLYWMKNHVNLFRGKGAGRLHDLLVAISRDPAMLRWLDGLTSTKRAPNENYSREYFELFTLGVDKGYVQADILEAARAFTGYRQVTLDRENGLLGVIFEPNRHDAGDKTIFGVTIPGQNATDDVEAVVSITIAERNVAEWIAESLLRYFCMPEPSDELIAQLASVLRDSDHDIPAALRALFRSEAFYSGAAKAGIVKGPVEMAIGYINATGLVITPNELEYRLDLMGQVPTRPPTVDGWPSGDGWLSAQGMLDRANLTRSCIGNRRLQQDLGIDVAELLPSENPTSHEVVDALALRVGVMPTPEQRDIYARLLDTQRLANGDIIDSPFDAQNPTHIDDRLRGLLYALAQHPDHMVR